MMFGTRETFKYVHCTACGCLQIERIPKDLTPYYPPTYYSMRDADPGACAPIWFRLLIRLRVYMEVFKRKDWTLFRKEMEWRLPRAYDAIVAYLRHGGIENFSARILDVGCGASAYRLRSCRQMGFRDLHGVDPYITADFDVDGIAVSKLDIEHVEGKYDFIMFHHSLEHIVDPVAALQAAARNLGRNGVCLIRIPVMSSALWQRYGSDWVELDAPRHLHVMEKQTIDLMARRAGMEVYHHQGDSEPWEFVASEQCRANVPIHSANSWVNDRRNDPHTNDELAAFAREAVEMNAAGTSGRACFYLRFASKPASDRERNR